MRRFVQKSKSFLWAITILVMSVCANRSALALDPEFERILGLRQAVQALIDQRNFAGLNQRLNGVQAQFESDQIAEQDLIDNFGIFPVLGESENAEVEQALTNWVEQTPDSYAARAARGIFYIQRGFDARGEEYASATKASQFQKMRSRFERGNKDLNESLNLTRKPLLSHMWLINTSITARTGNELEKHFNDAMQYAPESYLIRASYMGGLEPRWGGSYEQMEQFARESEAVFGPVDDAVGLWNMIGVDRANALIEQGRNDAAIVTLTEALNRRKSARLSCSRAYAHAELNKWNEAIDDLTASLEYAGSNGYCKSAMIRVAAFNSNRPSLLALLNSFVARNPDEAALYARRGMQRQNMKDVSGAFEDYETGATMGDTLSKVNAGRFLLNGWGGVTRNPDRAIMYIREAAETGDPYAKYVLADAVKKLGLQGEQAARDQARKQALNRMRPVKTTWEITKDKRRWGMDRLFDHRVIASVLGALLMMIWLRRERRAS